MEIELYIKYLALLTIKFLMRTTGSSVSENVIGLKDLFIKNTFSTEQIYNLLSSLNFFEKEYYSLDDRTISILKSEVSRITNLFISDYKVKNTFCPKKEDINFFGFSEVIEKGKIEAGKQK